MFDAYHLGHPLARESPSMTLASESNRFHDITSPWIGNYPSRSIPSPATRRLIDHQRPFAFGLAFFSGLTAVPR